MPLPQPWLEDALQQLDLRRRDRCLMLGCPTAAHLSAVSELVGRSANIVVVEPDGRLAEIATKGKHEHLEVLPYTPQNDDKFGVFDALLACPLTTMAWPLPLWSSLIPLNLRPGGRFVLDLPAEQPCDPLRRAWHDVGGEPGDLELLCGPAEAEVADELRQRGLRSVEACVGTHLLRLESSAVLGRLVRELVAGDKSLFESLERRLIEILQTTGEVDVVFHRTRVHGLR